MLYSTDVLGLSMIEGHNRAITATSSLTMHLSDMGDASITRQARAGGTGCESTEWKSSTSVQCSIGHRVSSTSSAVMTVGQKGGSVTQAFSVDVPRLSVMQRGNVVGTESASMTVYGAGLGLSSTTGKGRSGETACEGTEWVSETSVRCMNVRSSPGTWRALVTVGAQGGSMSEALSVDRPLLSGIGQP